MALQTQSENEAVSKQRRINTYKEILKYYRGRSFTLDVMLAATQEDLVISDEMKNVETIRQSTAAMYDDICLLQCLKESAILIQNSLTCFEILSNNLNPQGELFHLIDGVIYFSKALAKLYNEQESEINIINKKKSYLGALAEYGKKLDAVKVLNNNLNEDEEKVKEKAELLIYKINLIRAMKAILIGFASVNYPTTLQKFEQFQTHVRRNLTIEDFTNGCNIESIS